MDIRHWFLKYSFVVNLALIFGIAAVSAKATNLYVADSYLVEPAGNTDALSAPARQEQSYSPPVESIIERDLFDAGKDKATEPLSGIGDGDPQDMKVTDLRYSLVGVLYFGENNGMNVATIKDLKDMTSALYRAGDDVGDDAVLQEVQFDRIILVRKSGGLETMLLETEDQGQENRPPGYRVALEQLTPEQRAEQLQNLKNRQGRNADNNLDISDRVKKVGDKEFVIQKSAIDDTLSNLNNVVTQARVIPNYTGTGADREVDGFRIYRIQPGSIYQYLGLQNGDVIKSINGVKMDSIENGLLQLQSLRNETSFSMDIERQRNPLTLHYEVE